ncbi:trehalose/maltose hydrolase-like predicted phosphorylase [Kribbella orskensis]|uniref:Trehalose/maltose hydrolase-like predicted phosphorylase n=1 Tax=Kribbella orskensis TaxID=2512216 RepID=A0ABY2BP69_9ACTN|nr:MULTISPECIES: glycosyl hydrolase family 65 protein [Kribbella]TCN42225.1 trehalose/maltose hydrolase-like predicted phosphorylase [Kribbella sp. VKM Ac-2500]TCO26103.1 trehalose/maltose hydrolase-like predicted phosphorylase [Kribbella orskensis]
MNEWMLRFDDYDPADERRREALCTVGNGYFATRGAWAGSRASDHHYPGSYVAGLYNRLCDDIDGRTVENESLVNVPDWLPLEVAIDDGEWLTPDNSQVLDHQLELDLRRGVLTRRFRLRVAQGNIIAGVERRLVSMADAHLAAQSLAVTAENWSGVLRIRTGVDGSVTNGGVDRYQKLSGRHLVEIEPAVQDNATALVVARTSQSYVRIAVANRTAVFHNGTPCESGWTNSVDATTAYHEVAVAVQPGDVVSADKAAVVHTSRDVAISEPLQACLAALPGLPAFDRLLEPHVLAWSHLWRKFALDLEEPADGTPAAVRLNLFHLLQSVSPHSADTDAGVPARGLHGEAYRGHVFWDELFVFPVLTLRMPALTRALLRYRHRRLPAARRAAAAAGYPGAMYPWQSGSDGREESQTLHQNPLSGRWTRDATSLQRHVGLAVAYTMWQYVEATGDEEFLADHGAEVILEVARFFAGLASYDQARDRYVIKGVVGPDEFHTGYPERPDAGIDNNAYTNVMAVWLFRRAAEVLERLPSRRRTELTESIGLRPQELSRWDELTRRMYVPFHNGVISQFEGYADLDELDWDRYRRKYSDLRRLDRILEAEGLAVTAYQVSKQADVLMLLYLLPRQELYELLATLGYPTKADTIRRTVRYYLPRTCHGSSLSAVVHAWGLTSLNADRALEFLVQALHSDSGDPAQTGTTAEGIHLAAMAGSVDLVQRCFTGLTLSGDELRFAPRWPVSLGRMRMNLRYRGHHLTVRVSADGLAVSADAGRADPIRVRCHGTTKSLAAGRTVEWPAR